MIKGCLLKFIIIFTIVLAAVVYIVENKFDKLFLTPDESLAIAIIVDGWEKNLDYVKDTPEKESLNILLDKYISGIHSDKDKTKFKIEKIIKLLAISFKDSLINGEELNHISKIINDVLKK